MKRMREKLHSRRGLTILMALLFFLVCMLVAASVLMAAVSNAGKLRSNYEQQQKYLALSSAIRLVSGQIEKAEYTGNYTVKRWKKDIYTENEKGEQILVDTIYYYQVCQTPGKFTCGELTDTNVPEFSVLDFRPELDGLYAKEFAGVGYAPLPDGEIAALPSRARTLTVEVGGEGEQAQALKEKFPPVTVKVTMDAGRRIHLTATLSEGGGEEGGEEGRPGAVYQMEAELYAVGTLSVDFIPLGGELPTSGQPGGDHVSPLPDTVRAKPDEPDVKWKLDWIDRKEAG